MGGYLLSSVGISGARGPVSIAESTEQLKFKGGREVTVEFEIFDLWPVKHDAVVAISITSIHTL